MYYRHFRLTGPPFEALAGPEALYLSQAHRESLAALEWGLLHEPSGFTTLTGETGTGKTTLVSSILARNFAQLRAAYVINPKLSFEDILRVVLGQFGVPCMEPNKLDRIEALVSFLGARMPNERLAIIVDEAQDLSDDVLEELRLLSNYGQRIGKYLQLVLVGQPELALRLKSPSLRQFNQRVAARSVLNRLSFVEAHEYVGYRLRARDGRSRDIFDSEALDYLLRHSAGIPRQINVLCHNAMLLAYSSGAPLVDLKSARAAVCEHGGSLLGGAWTLTIPSKGVQPIYVGVAALGLLLLWMELTGLTMTDGGTPSVGLQILADLSFVLACFGSCFGVLAVALRFAALRLPALTGLNNSAYGMYLVHYPFVVWLQYALLSAALPAIIKGAGVFGATLLFSSGTIAALRCVPSVAQIIGTGRARGVATS